MHKVLVAGWPRTLVLPIALYANPLQAGWGGAEWNMSPEQVATSTGGQAPLSSGKRVDRLDGRKIGNVGEHVMAGAKFRTVYYYDDLELAQITFSGRPRDCSTIAQSLVEQYGEPDAMTDQLILRTVTWHDPPNGNHLTLLVSRSLCDMILQRLPH